MEAAVALLRAAPEHKLKMTVLNKALFYLDLVCLRDLGETFTQNTYVALPEGPVVAKYEKRLVEALESHGLARVEADPISGARPVVLTAEPELVYANEYVVDKAAEIARSRLLASASDASALSHKNPGWQLAWSAGLGSGAGGQAKPIDLLVAMQQVVDDDPWLHEALSQEEERAFMEAESEPGIPW